MSTLAEMANEVEAVNKDKGWYDDDRTFFELTALQHSEVSEALEAYRTWGLKDATPMRESVEALDLPGPTKPEGVGSEFADILIRLLDMSKRYGIDLNAEVAKHHGAYGINNRFGDAACVLHMLISRLAYAYDAQVDGPDPDYPIEPHFVAVYRYLAQWAEHLGIDLEAEYRRKVDYNKTRPYRHGGKKLLRPMPGIKDDAAASVPVWNQCHHVTRVLLTNRKGRQFWECSKCGAFLGWA